MVDHIRKLYSDLPIVFAKDLARKQATLSASNNTSSASNTSGQGGNVGASTPSQTQTQSHPSTPASPPNHLKRERQDDGSAAAEGNSAKRRDTGEGKSRSPISAGSTSGRSGSMPPPSLPASAGARSPPTVMNGPTTFSVPMSGGLSSQSQQQQGQQPGHQRQPSAGPSPSGSVPATPTLPRHSTPTPAPQTPKIGTGQLPGSTQSQNPSSSQHSQPNLSNLSQNPNPSQSNHHPSNDLLSLPGGGSINSAEAQLAAANRERARQTQIRMAQAQQAQMRAQQQQSQGMSGVNPGMGGGQAGGMGTNMAGGMGGAAMSMGNIGGGGMGDMMPPATPRLMQPQANLMGINGMGGGMSGGQGNMSMGGGVQGSGGGMQGQPGQGSQPGQSVNANQALMHQMIQYLRTPNHPFVKFMLQNVPGFETMPAQMQIQKMIGARVCESLDLGCCDGGFRSPILLSSASWISVSIRTCDADFYLYTECFNATARNATASPTASPTRKSTPLTPNDEWWYQSRDDDTTATGSTRADGQCRRRYGW